MISSSLGAAMCGHPRSPDSQRKFKDFQAAKKAPTCKERQKYRGSSSTQPLSRIVGGALSARRSLGVKLRAPTQLPAIAHKAQQWTKE